MIASKREYDVAIIGGGIGGLMTAYEITNNRPDLKIILFESGKTLKDRACPIVTGKVEQCIGCTPCSIMRGIAGAGVTRSLSQAAANGLMVADIITKGRKFYED